MKTIGNIVAGRQIYHAFAHQTVRERQAGCRHLPVVEGDRLIGMVSQRDLLQIDLTEKDEEIRWLNAYIHFIPPAREGTS
jgi:CBS domain-containing protein